MCAVSGHNRCPCAARGTAATGKAEVSDTLQRAPYERLCNTKDYAKRTLTHQRTSLCMCENHDRRAGQSSLALQWLHAAADACMPQGESGRRQAKGLHLAKIIACQVSEALKLLDLPAQHQPLPNIIEIHLASIQSSVSDVSMMLQADRSL